ncbi:hypothetical protein B0H14DRAFT_2598050 [Mycena olivaceomarginata]|nr:hypothetical protein B0H14DRAFT_2598050 [Mycena olivaceomarginata]
MPSQEPVEGFLFEVLAKELQAARDTPAFTRYSSVSEVMEAFKMPFDCTWGSQAGKTVKPEDDSVAVEKAGNMDRVKRWAAEKADEPTRFLITGPRLRKTSSFAFFPLTILPMENLIYITPPFSYAIYKPSQVSGLESDKNPGDGQENKTPRDQEEIATV